MAFQADDAHKAGNTDIQVEARERRPTFARLFSGAQAKVDGSSTFAGPNFHRTDSSEDESLGELGRGLTDKNGNNVSLEQYYAPIDTYEGKHRYDPKATWSAAEETALIRKLDVRVCAYVCFMFFALQLDRGNINQALSDNLLKDLHMNTNDYNTGQTIFYVSFLAAELPSQLVSKKIGPDNWIPIQMISWSIVACCQSRLDGRATFFLFRSLLGIIEGGFIPDVILYLSYFYKSKELPIRLSFFWASYGMTFIISAFLGFYLPPSPYQTASRFRGKNGWFSEREEVILANRIIRDDPSKGDMHNRQAVTPRLLWHALKDYDMWPIYLLGLSWTIPNQTANAYLTLILRSLKFDTFETNLLTIPAYVIFITQMIFLAWISERINNRYLIILYCQIWLLPITIALEVLPGGQAYAWSRYVLNTMLVGFPYVHPIIVAMTSRNAGSVRTRTVGSALYNMCVQASNVISSNIYRNPDKPLYRTGNKVLLGLIAWNITLIVASKIYYHTRNKRRDRIWQAMTEAEKAHYLQTTKDEGNKR
ncbi:MAG: hypothetical protein Q9220_003638 [cf. Caloplaca sp. 1 TL-2023]